MVSYVTQKQNRLLCNKNKMIYYVIINKMVLYVTKKQNGLCKKKKNGLLCKKNGFLCNKKQNSLLCLKQKQNGLQCNRKTKWSVKVQLNGNSDLNIFFEVSKNFLRQVSSTNTAPKHLRLMKKEKMVT